MTTCQQIGRRITVFLQYDWPYNHCLLIQNFEKKKRSLSNCPSSSIRGKVECCKSGGHFDNLGHRLLSYQYLVLKYDSPLTTNRCPYWRESYSSTRVQVVQLYHSTDTATAWKNSHFISSEWSDFHMLGNLFLAFHALPEHMLTLFSVDKIYLPRYMKWSTNLIGLPFNKEIVTYELCLIRAHIETNIACSRLYSRDLAWAGIFARSARSFV